MTGFLALEAVELLVSVGYHAGQVYVALVEIKFWGPNIYKRCTFSKFIHKGFKNSGPLTVGDPRRRSCPPIAKATPHLTSL